MNQVERKCVPCVYYKYVIGLEDLPVGLGCVAMIAEEISITTDFFLFFHGQQRLSSLTSS